MHYPKRAMVWATIAVLAFGASAGCSPQEPKLEPPGSVAILVVDDFDVIKPGVTRPTHFGTGHAGKNCTFQSQEVGGKGATGTSIPQGMSHGAYVFDQVADMLDQIGGPNGKLGISGPVDMASINLAGKDKGWARHARRWTYAPDGVGSTGDPLEILVIGVDTDEYETRDVTSRLTAAIDALNEKKINRIVANLSFQIAPCDPNEFLKAAGNFVADVDSKLLLALYQAIVEKEQGDLKQFLENLPQGYDLAQLRAPRFASLIGADAAIPPDLWVYLFHGILAGLPLPPDPRSPAPGSPASRQGHDRLKGDPLIGFLDNSSIVPVGAAGNGLHYNPPGKDTDAVFTFPFPFAPALWDSVVSVSAIKTSHELEPYSNSGEVVRFGTVDLARTADSATEDQWMIPVDRRDDAGPPQGTSFAAPRLSAVQAVYLLKGGQARCGNHRPPLGYTALGSAGSGTGTEWRNLDLSEAAKQYCSGFVKTATP